MTKINPQTNTANPQEPITWEALLGAYQKFCKDNPLPKTLKCSPQYYLKLTRFIEDQAAEDMTKGVKLPPPSKWGAIFGIDIYIDADMKPGEWKFVY